jgi:hypothetical protein
MPQTKANRKARKGPGRPPTGKGTQIGERWRDAELDAIDAWRRREKDLPSRAEAVRRLVRLGLLAKQAKDR